MSDPLAVVGVMMLVGLVVCAPIAAIEGVPARLHGEAWLWLILAGAGNIAGLMIGYYALRRGQVALVMPLISTEGSVAAVIAIAAGETLKFGAAIALVLAAVGIGAVSIPPKEAAAEAEGASHVGTVVLAGTAALFFGLSLYTTGRAAAELPSAWVVLSARAIGTVVVAIPLALRGRLRVTRKALPLVITSGLAEVIGFFSYAVGTRHGIAVAAVLGSQFAAISAAFAYFAFGERLTRVQVAGVCTILLAVSLLSAVNA